jgi:hypothetical protein
LDTKLKKSKIVGYGFYCIAWILAIAVAAIVFGALSVFIAQEHVIQLNDMPIDPEEGTHYFAGRITNIVLFIIYVSLAPLYMFLAMIANPRYDGFLGILGWIVAIIMGSSALFCGLGLGFSVALRKKGKSKLSFAAQFAGFAGVGLNLILFFVFYRNLLRPLN